MQYNNDYKFYFDMGTQRDDMYAVPMLISKFKGKEIELDLDEEHGGGVSDVAMLILRTVSIVLYRPKIAQVLVADEPYKHTSRGNLERVCSLLQKLRDMLKMQIIIITHKDEFRDIADKSFSVRQLENGVSKIKEVE